MQRHAGNEAADRHRVLRCLALARPRQRDDLAGLAVDLVIELFAGPRRKHGMDDLAPGDMPLADGDEEVVDAGAAETLEDRLEALLDEIVTVLAERLLQDRLAEIVILLALLG